MVDDSFPQLQEPEKQFSRHLAIHMLWKTRNVPTKYLLLNLIISEMNNFCSSGYTPSFFILGHLFKLLSPSTLKPLH